jgi:hypothetical protein
MSSLKYIVHQNTWGSHWYLVNSLSNWNINIHIQLEKGEKLMYDLYLMREGKDSVLLQSGTTSMILWKEDDKTRFRFNDKPKEGVSLRIGTPNKRNWTDAPYFQTEIIESIISDNNSILERDIVFKTNQYTYMWKEK